MRGPQRPALRLLSLNVNGLSSSQHKRRLLFHLLMQQQWDAILLQETHCANDVEATRWCREGLHRRIPGPVQHSGAMVIAAAVA